MTAQPIQRVVILGHTGFIGARLLERFRRQSPAVEVVGRSLPEVDLLKADQVAGLAEDCGWQTAVIVCAGIKRQWGDTLETFEQNLRIALNLGRLFQQRPPGRVIFFSSAAVYGEELQNTSITEQTPVEPTSLYGVAKYTSERLLRQALGAAPAECSLVILRPPLIYGPGDQSRGYGPTGFARAAVTGMPIVLWGDGCERRDFVFVEDVAELVWQVTFQPFAGVLNVVTGQSVSFRDVLDVLARLAPRPLDISARPRSKPQVDHVYTNSGLRTVVPDLVFTPLETGVRLTFEALQGEAAMAAESQ